MFHNNAINRREMARRFTERMNAMDLTPHHVAPVTTQENVFLDACLQHNQDAALLQGSEDIKKLANLRVRPIEFVQDVVKCKFISGNKPSVVVALKALEEKKRPVVLDAVYTIEGVKVYNSITTVIRDINGDFIELEHRSDIKMNTTYHLRTPGVNLIGDVTRDRATVQLNNLMLNKDLLGPLPTALLTYKQGQKFTPPPLDEDLRGCGLTGSLTNIWGPPGTGKTWTIVKMLGKFASHDKMVFVLVPHNRGVAAVSQQLCDAGVNHWLFINSKKAELYPSSSHAKKVGSRMFEDDFRNGINSSDASNADFRRFYKHSSIVLMTTSRGMSVTKNKLILKPDVLFIDEVYLVPFYIFLALLALNFRALVLSGDPKQHPPYIEIDPKNRPQDVTSRASNALSLANLSVVYDFPDSSQIILGNGTMRMPQAYTEIFGAIFYPELECYQGVKIDYAKDYSYTVHNSPGRGKTRYEKNSLGESVIFNEDVARGFAPIVNKGSMVVTPYVGQAALYSRNEEAFVGLKVNFVGIPRATASTFRAAQGSESDVVLVDLVKSSCFLSVTNSSADVALSRHKRHIHISHVPDVTMEWMDQHYHFDVNKTVRQNFINFINIIHRRNYHWGNPPSGWDHPIKWRFFIWMLEHVQSMKCHKSPGRSFNIMARGKLITPSYAMMLKQATDDEAVLNVLALSIQGGNPVLLNPESFRNPKNYKKYIKAMENDDSENGTMLEMQQQIIDKKLIDKDDDSLWAFPIDSKRYLEPSDKPFLRFFGLNKNFKIYQVYPNFYALYQVATRFRALSEPYHAVAAQYAQFGDLDFLWALVE
jgi:hypothetical protein